MMTREELQETRRGVERLMKVLVQTEGLQRRTRHQVNCSGSQGGEGKRLLELLPLGKPGSYVDVGAYSPEECSNTWQFYQAGWRGLLIEPLPSSHVPLLLQRPGDILWPKAAHNYDGVGRLRLCESVSSMNPNWKIQDCGELLVETETLGSILARFPKIRDTCRLCSIDVEGLEREVLEGIDFRTFHPDVFIIEYLEFTTGMKGRDLSGEWAPLLTEHGKYREVWRSNMNAIFLRNDLDIPWKKTTNEDPGNTT